jgi:transcriptional regulator with XRE-family HTH domain
MLYGGMFLPAQCRAARALLDWSQQQLADAARVGIVTVRTFESGQSQPRNSTLDVMQRALEAAGVVFLEPGALIEGGQGVRLHVTPNTPEVLASKIKVLEGELSRPEPDLSPSPEAGMRQLERARKRNVVATLKNRPEETDEG